MSPTALIVTLSLAGLVLEVAGIGLGLLELRKALGRARERPPLTWARQLSADEDARRELEQDAPWRVLAVVLLLAGLVLSTAANVVGALADR